MSDLLGHYNYWIVIVLMMTGFYTVIARPNLVKKIIGEWGYDGLKIDGQHLNGADHLRVLHGQQVAEYHSHGGAGGHQHEQPLFHDLDALARVFQTGDHPAGVAAELHVGGDLAGEWSRHLSLSLSRMRFVTFGR